LQHINPSTSPNELNTTLTPHSMIHADAYFAYFNKINLGHPRVSALEGRAAHCASHPRNEPEFALFSCCFGLFARYFAVACGLARDLGAKLSCGRTSHHVLVER